MGFFKFIIGLVIVFLIISVAAFMILGADKIINLLGLKGNSKDTDINTLFQEDKCFLFNHGNNKPRYDCCYSCLEEKNSTMFAYNHTDNQCTCINIGPK